MRVLITGGRDFSDRRFVFWALGRIHARRPISTIIEGGATGADSLGRSWAEANNIPAFLLRLTGRYMAVVLALSETARCFGMVILIWSSHSRVDAELRTWSGSPKSPKPQPFLPGHSKYKDAGFQLGLWLYKDVRFGVGTRKGG